MLVDSREPALSATHPFLPALFPNVDRSGMTEGSVSMVGSGRESMAVSLDQARLGRALIELGFQLVVEVADTALLYTKLGASLFPAVVDRACFEHENRENERLENRLRMAFEAEPLEDGIDHPAERIIDDALRSVHGRPVLAWFRALSVDVERPGLAASVLRCLGRRRPGTSAWRVEIVRSALAADDVEMRDAAVQVAESWGDPGMREVLSSHTEAVPWLRAYIEDVVEDLGE